jgi:hypothetical protein
MHIEEVDFCEREKRVRLYGQQATGCRRGPKEEKRGRGGGC